MNRQTRPNGTITVVENGITVPFDTRRVYYIYDVPGGEARGDMPINTCISLLWLPEVVLM